MRNGSGTASADAVGLGNRGLRELLISRSQSGHLALYSYDKGAGMALILAVRHQREQDYH
jgi:hypothetical protein